MDCFGLEGTLKPIWFMGRGPFHWRRLLRFKLKFLKATWTGGNASTCNPLTAAMGVTCLPWVLEAPAMWQRSPWTSWGQTKINTEREWRLSHGSSTGNVCLGSLSRDWKQHTQINQPAQLPGTERPEITRRLQRAQGTLDQPMQFQCKVRVSLVRGVPPPSLKKKPELEKGNFLQSQFIQRSNQPWNIHVSQSINIPKIMERFVWVQGFCWKYLYLAKARVRKMY